MFVLLSLSSLVSIQTHDNIAMTVIYIIHKTVKYLLPQWAIFVLFSPLKPRPTEREGEMDETDTFSWVEKPVSFLCGVIHLRIMSGKSGSEDIRCA